MYTEHNCDVLIFLLNIKGCRQQGIKTQNNPERHKRIFFFSLSCISGSPFKFNVGIDAPASLLEIRYVGVPSGP